MGSPADAPPRKRAPRLPGRAQDHARPPPPPPYAVSVSGSIQRWRSTSVLGDPGAGAKRAPAPGDAPREPAMRPVVARAGTRARGGGRGRQDLDSRLSLVFSPWRHGATRRTRRNHVVPTLQPRRAPDVLRASMVILFPPPAGACPALPSLPSATRGAHAARRDPSAERARLAHPDSRELRAKGPILSLRSPHRGARALGAHTSRARRTPAAPRPPRARPDAGHA